MVPRASRTAIPSSFERLPEPVRPLTGSGLLYAAVTSSAGGRCASFAASWRQGAACARWLGKPGTCETGRVRGRGSGASQCARGPRAVQRGASRPSAASPPARNRRESLHKREILLANPQALRNVRLPRQPNPLFGIARSPLRPRSSPATTCAGRACGTTGPTENPEGLFPHGIKSHRSVCAH